MKALRSLILRVAMWTAISLPFNAAWLIFVKSAIRLGGDDGCIFHKPRGQWTKDDHDFLERRIRRIEAMPEGGK